MATLKPETSTLEQRYDIGWQIITGLTAAVTILVTGYCVIPAKSTGLETATDRFMFTLRWQTLSVCMVLVGVRLVGSTRFKTRAIDPTDAKGKLYTSVKERCLQNTVEQVVLSVANQLILSTYLSAATVAWLIPSLVATFVFGRIMFFVGYSISPLKRGYGFALTFFPTVFVTALNFYHLLFWGPAYK